MSPNLSGKCRGASPSIPYFAYRTLEWLLAPIALSGLVALRLPSNNYREITLKRLGILKTDELKIKKKGRPIFWVHALSYGEVKAVFPLLKRIKEHWKESVLIGSSSTPTGMLELCKMGDSILDLTIPMPFDFTPCFLRHISRLKPDCFLLVETDVWPNFLWQLKRRGTRLVLVNGSISERARSRLSMMPWVSRFIYGAFAKIGMQSEKDRDRLISTGIDASDVVAVGNMKFDIDIQDMDNVSKSMVKELGLRDDGLVVVLGSSHPGEEEAVLPSVMALRQLSDQRPIEVFVVPRDPGRAAEIKALFESQGVRCSLRTQLAASNQASVASPNHSFRCIIVDTLGELLKIYSISHVAIVGGTFVPIGGHNILEPASFGLPVIVGPYVESIEEICEGLEKAGGLFRISGKEGLKPILLSLLKDPSKRDSVGKAAKHFVERNKGVIERYIHMIEEALRDGRK